MSSETSRYLKFGGATVLILLSLGYLAYTGVQESKSYYVTIKELRGMGDSAHTKRLRASRSAGSRFASACSSPIASFTFPIASAVANALFHLTGQRVRKLPFARLAAAGTRTI